MKKTIFLPLIGTAMLTTLAVAVEEATPVEQMSLKDGFQVELLYSVPKEAQGSWVALCTDPKGRFIASDQYGGLYRFQVPASGQKLDPSAIEKIDLPIGEAHGLLYAFDSLYVMVANDAYEGRGLYRVRDTDGDDKFDEVKQLKKLYDGGEHGPHAIVLSPDGESLYIVSGNQTVLPQMEETRVPPVWQEDQLLPRVYGRGFMRGIEAPRGFIAKTDPNGEHWELIATGFRNEYDAAFNRDGELFTYDADMEWDVSTPWYRPTRVCQVVSGAEFGWRNGSAKWPAYYEDSVPATVDIGPGSPTGVTFGYGAKFPAKYQNAFFISDWSYGKLYAVHLNPKGAGYDAEVEEFISAQPLPLTDVLIHPGDGAMYFAIGGRRVQSGFYRVTYHGSESTAPAADAPNDEAAKLRMLRRKLESFHGKRDPDAVDFAWPYLSHDDRLIRFAARVAIEHQPVTSWFERAINEKNDQAKLMALMALARTTYPSNKLNLLQAMKNFRWDKLDRQQRLTLIRIYGLIFSRLGEPEESARAKVLTQLDRRFPSGNRDLDVELCQLLVYLKAPEVAKRTVALMGSAPTQEEQLAYAKSLRLLADGWTMEDRKGYFQWFVRAANYRGGASFGQFVENIKADAVAKLSEAELKELQPILDAKPEATGPQFSITPREFVKEWKVADLESLLNVGLEGNRNFANGRNLFGAATCFSCHRFGGEGGAVGPDLTGVGGRFSPKDLLESIIEPSKEISDQYNATVVTKMDESTVMGRVVNLNGDGISLNTDMMDPNATVTVNRQDIKAMGPATISMMPPGLLNTLKDTDILDLVAYLLSQGNSEHPMFK